MLFACGDKRLKTKDRKTIYFFYFMINPNIFKSYDIRGVYPKELNEETAYAIGRAFARRAEASAVTVGMDMRLSGPQLKAELIRGITDEGVNVIDVGLVPIDAIYFAVSKLKHEAGIMITASHNPKDYNGFKMVKKNMEWVRGKELKDEVLNLPKEVPNTKGEVQSADIMFEYIDHLRSFVDTSKIKPFKVVVDAGNGMAGSIVPLLETYLPIKTIPLNFTLDGSFPAHPSNPLLPESQVQIKEAVIKNQADFGVIFDGDTDRLFFVDEKGNFIRADYALLILAKEFLNREPGAGIVHNVICSKIVSEKITEWGGRAIRSEVGFVNISKHMREEQGIMGGEVSAHYSFRDNGYADSGFIAWLIMMQLVSEYDQPLSEIIKPFMVYFKSDEMNFTVNNQTEILEKIKQTFTDGKQNFLDGVTVEYPDWWFNVRPSNTEPLLRVTVEANSEDLLKERIEEIVKIVKS